MLFFENFQSKDDEEEENPSWLYPLLYALLAIFIAVFSAFIGFWLYKKKDEYNLYKSEGKTRVLLTPFNSVQKPQFNSQITNYSKKNQKTSNSLKNTYQRFLAKHVNNNYGPNTPVNTYPEQRAGKYKRKNISIKRRR